MRSGMSATEGVSDMTLMHRAVGAIVGVLAFVALLGAPAGAQVGKLVDPNMAAESDMAQLPHITPAIVKGMIENRPLKTVDERNKYFLDQKLTPDHSKEYQPKAFLP